MAFDLTKLVKPTSSSWTDFYYNMALASSLPGTTTSDFVLRSQLQAAQLIGVKVEDIKDSTNAVSNMLYAKRLTEEYDKAVMGGKIIFGGVPIKVGNTTAMQATLFYIMMKTSKDPNGDLLRDIGPAIYAYWLGAQTDKMATPNIPCIGAIKNIKTIFGVTLFPGVWIPISIPSVGSVDPFLLSFIASASLHLLTVAGIITCMSQYPPPAPPATGILPWSSYFVKPFTGTPASMAPGLGDIATLGKAAALNIGKPLLGDAIAAIFADDPSKVKELAIEIKNTQ